MSEGETFPWAIAPRVGPLAVPSAWRDWAQKSTREVAWFHVYPRKAEQLLRLLVRHPLFSERADLAGIRVLDVGCTPAVSALLAGMGAAVTLVDLAPDELIKAKDLRDELHLGDRLRGLQADAFRLPLLPDAFDLVWNAGFIEHFDDPVGVIRIMATHCRPGGAVAILVPNHWTPHSLYYRDRLRHKHGGYYWDFMGKERSFSPRQLRRMMQEAGLTVLHSSAFNLRRTLLDDNYMLHRFRTERRNRLLHRLMNLMDFTERYFPPVRLAGFFSGAVAIKPVPGG